MLVEQTLFGVTDKVKEAVNILQKYEPPEGYYLAFSGGKDSLCCYYLCKIAGVKFDAHYNFTTVDPPELVAFVRTFDDVIIDHPGIDKTMWALIVKHGIPPMRNIRYCCKELKENKAPGCIQILGVREEESSKRKGRKVLNFSSPLGDVINIIYYWSEAEVWEFIGCNLIDYCSLYDEGYSRLGCVGCPMGRAQKMVKAFERYPLYKQAYLRTFEKMLEEWAYREKERPWKTAQDVFDWWVYGSGQKIDDRQLNLWDLEELENEHRTN